MIQITEIQMFQMQVKNESQGWIFKSLLHKLKFLSILRPVIRKLVISMTVSSIFRGTFLYPRVICLSCRIRQRAKDRPDKDN